jgi:hypothetical protein
MSSAKARVLEDGSGRRATYDDIEVGHSLGEMEWEITDDMIELQCRLDEDFDRLFCLPQSNGSRIAPPQITYRPPRWLFSRAYNVRGLFVRWEMEMLGLIRSGTKVKVTGSIVDKFIKKDREFVVYQAEGRDPEGELLFRTKRTHVLDFIERSAPRAGTGVDSGIKPERI